MTKKNGGEKSRGTVPLMAAVADSAYSELALLPTALIQNGRCRQQCLFRMGAVANNARSEWVLSLTELIHQKIGITTRI